MSFISCYHAKNRAVMVSDNLVSAFVDGKHVALGEKASKFQVIETQSGPIFLGAIGRYDLSQRLMAGVPKMDHLDFMGLRKRLPTILQMLVANRTPSTIAPERDGLQACLVGFDHAEQRIRAFVFIAGDGFTGIETTTGDNCFFALGWLPDAEMEKLQDFSSGLGRSAPRLGVAWAAREMGKKLDELSSLYPGQVGKSSHFAALDSKGRFELPADLPLPSMTESAVAVGAEMAMAGTNRFFVGSVWTPPMGGSPTTGNSDGGAGAQTASPQTVFIGAYSSSVAYLVGNQVSYSTGGAEGLYQCIQPCVNKSPTNTTYWILISILLPAAASTSSVINSTIPKTSSGSVSIFSASIDIPASGGPYRILASYAVYVSSTFASNGLDTWCSDGSNTFGFFEYFENSGMNGSTICSSCCGYSPAYNAGAGTVTITLYAQNNANSTSTLSVVSGAKEGPGTSNLTLAVIQAQ